MPAGCGQGIRTDDAQVAVCATVPPGEEPLVDVRAIHPRIIIDVRYATADNFMKRVLYPANRVLLRASVARRLAKVQDDLERSGLGLKLHDGYRPWSIQKQMWALVPDDDYVADPRKGSRHNRGAAVDATLVDRAGRELEMPSPYDEFSERAHADYAGGTAAGRHNRNVLIRAMRRRGFKVLKTEWWHFDGPGWEHYSVLDVPLAAPASAPSPSTDRGDPQRSPRQLLQS